MWDDSEFSTPDYSQYDTSGSDWDTGGYDQIGGDGGSYMDASQDYGFSDAFQFDPNQFGNLGQMFSMTDGPQMQNNFSLPQGTFDLPQQQEQFGFGGADQAVGVQPYGGNWEQAMQLPTNGATGGMDWGKGLGGLSQVLGGLFNQRQGGVTGKQIGALGAALLEGRQNKQMASQVPQVVQQQQQRQSPFDVASTGASQMGANSMRDAMQQKLAAAMQDPYGQKIVKDQVDAIAKAQAIKDAAAGRRSNMATSSPAMLAEQAKVAQNYINSLQNPAGANINPTSQGLTELLQALKYGTNGYTSPIMSALGYGQSTNSNSDAMLKVLQALGKTGSE